MYNTNQQYGRYGYSPYQQQPVQVQQPMYQQAISIQDMPIQAVRFMNEAEAKAYVLLPNQKEMLIDREKGVAYLKYTDTMGQSTCKVFKFEEMQDSKNTPSIDTSNFVTKDDTKDFVSRKDFDDLLHRFENLRAQLKPKVQP